MAKQKLKRLKIFNSKYRVSIKNNNFLDSGYFINRFIPVQPGEKALATTFMLANSVSVQRKISELTFSTKEMKETFSNYWNAHNENPLIGRDKIIASICPKVLKF